MFGGFERGVLDPLRDMLAEQSAARA